MATPDKKKGQKDDKDKNDKNGKSGSGTDKKGSGKAAPKKSPSKK